MKTNSDILTIKAVLLYILERIPDTKRSVYFVVKTAFYAQRNHLAQWGTPLLEDDICALPFGPVPSTTYDILKGVRGKELQDTRLIDAAKSIYLSNEDFFPTESADMDYLSKSAIDCINQALAEISQKSFAEILDTTHESQEYLDAYKYGKGLKIMNPINIARDAGADEGMQEYISEYYELKITLG